MNSLILSLAMVVYAHAESCEKQYEQARVNGIDRPYCHEVLKPDPLAGVYCLTYDGPSLGPVPSPSPRPSVQSLKVKALKPPKPVHLNPSARGQPILR